LGIAGETTWRVPSLSLPDPARLLPVESLKEYEAIRLFIERALTILPSFEITHTNVAAMAQVCQQLDGIPLAIELAAARVKVLSVEQIATRLHDRFQLLTQGSRTALPRHQTLRGAMDWSYDLLSDHERVLLRRTSVFTAGFTLEAVEEVCAGQTIQKAQILDLLSRLVDKSLVIVEGTDGGEPRYRLLETVRQYAADRLAESGEATPVRLRHRDRFLALAEEAEQGLRGPEQEAWTARLAIELDNLRAVLDWCKTEEGGPDAGLRVAGALGLFWDVRGYLSEGRRWLEGLLSLATGASDATRAKALNWAGVLAYRQGDYARVRTLCEEALALSRSAGDQWGTALAFTTSDTSHNLKATTARP